ncbi:MAG: hypothetical protein M0P57_07255 [Syntrophales bacterium]|jgi:uncharacterized delta-60 repeat protein|nr:hypothetical protein [Syntrophales bacterium]MDY0044703.1 hypothetical protein [Syntrophales bacterium]
MKKKILTAALFLIVCLTALSWTCPAISKTIVREDFNPVFAAPGSVTGIIPLSGNKILITGTFTTISGYPAKHIARLNADGTVDRTFEVSGNIQVDQIRAAAGQADGKILIGGYLTRYKEASTQSYLFRLNADGSLDETFDAGGYDWQTGSYGISGLVRAIKVDENGKILVGGDFTAPRNRIIRLNPDGSVDPTFEPGSGADGSVTHIAIEASGSIVIGGSFATINGSAKRGIARLDESGSLDGAFGAGVAGGDLFALALQPDGKILIAGSFSQAAGQTVSKMARFETNGTLDSTFQPSGGSSLIGNYLHEITALAASENYIFVGGWNPVMYFDGKPTDHNAAVYVLHEAGGGFYSYARFKGKPTDVWALAERSDGTVLAGGSFTYRDDPSDEGLYAGLCLFSGPYFLPDANFKPIVGGQANVQALALQSDGKILAGGEFYLINGHSAPGVARLFPSGEEDPALTTLLTAGGSVTDVRVRSDGKLVVGGTFYSIAGQDYKDVALLDPNGSVEASAYVGRLRALALQSDGKILAAADAMANSPGIWRLNEDLSIDGTFTPGEGISNYQQSDYEFDRINAVAVQPDGKILLGGSFSSFSGSAVQNIVRLNPNGSLDATFTSPAFTVFNSRSEIFSIALQPDGKILIGGRFSTVGTIESPTLARLNANGTMDETFSSPFGDQGLTAYSICVQDDGKILVGGNMQIYDAVNGKLYNSLVRLGQNGLRDVSFNASVTGTVRKILASGERIIIAGSFEAADGVPRQGMACYTFLRADVNHDDRADLADVILILKTLVGDVTGVFADGDINNDGKLGLQEIEYLLQKIAEVR